MLRGERIAPVYDGYEENADGSYSMWFGYFNRNWKEDLGGKAGLPVIRVNC